MFMEALGHSDELIIGWNLCVVNFSDMVCVVGILIEDYCGKLGKIFKCINCSAPYSNQVKLWNNIMDVGLLLDPCLIVGGDLKFYDM